MFGHYLPIIPLDCSHPEILLHSNPQNAQDTQRLSDQNTANPDHPHPKGYHLALGSKAFL